MTRSLLLWAIAAPCLLASMDVGLWWLLREEALQRALPSMVAQDLGEQGIRHVPYGKNIADVVVVNEGHPPFAPGVMRELRAAFKRVELSAHFEPELARQGTSYDECCKQALSVRSGDSGPPVGCMGFRYWTRVDTPLIAEVYTDQHLCTGGSSVFLHRRLWFFGTWLPISHRLAGQE